MKIGTPASRQVFVLCILTFLVLSCQTKVQDKKRMQGLDIRITYEVNGVSEPFNAPFQFGIQDSLGDTIFNVKQKKNLFFLPQNILVKDEKYNYYFIYNGEKLNFDTVKLDYSDFQKNVEWKFGKEERPFPNVGGIFSSETINKDIALKKIYFWKLGTNGDPSKQVVRKIY